MNAREEAHEVMGAAIFAEIKKWPKPSEFDPAPPGWWGATEREVGRAALDAALASGVVVLRDDLERAEADLASAKALLDEFDIYASTPPTDYNGSPFMERVRAFLAGEDQQ